MAISGGIPKLRASTTFSTATRASSSARGRSSIWSPGSHTIGKFAAGTGSPSRSSTCRFPTRMGNGSGAGTVMTGPHTGTLATDRRSDNDQLLYVTIDEFWGKGRQADGHILRLVVQRRVTDA